MYCIKTAKRRITPTTPRDRPGTLVFWCQNSLVDDPLKFALKVTHPPFKQHDFDQYLLIAPQPWDLAKKVQLALIGSRSRAFQRGIDEPCTLALSPPTGGTKRDFAIFSRKFQLLSNKVCYKVSSCENFQRQSWTTSFLYLRAHRRIAGNVAIYQTFALKVTHRRRKTPISTDFA